MPCKDYCNNGYFCGGCKHFTRSTTIAVTDGQVVITIPSETVRNHEKFCICLAQNIPDRTFHLNHASSILNHLFKVINSGKKRQKNCSHIVQMS